MLCEHLAAHQVRVGLASVCVARIRANGAFATYLGMTDLKYPDRGPPRVRCPNSTFVESPSDYVNACEDVSEADKHAVLEGPPPESPSELQKLMFRLGSKYGTDKVLVHRYHEAYGSFIAYPTGRIFARNWNSSVGILENGLPCFLECTYTASTLT